MILHALFPKVFTLVTTLEEELHGVLVVTLVGAEKTIDPRQAKISLKIYLQTIRCKCNVTQLT